MTVTTPDSRPYVRYDRLVEAYESLGYRRVDLGRTHLETPLVAFWRDQDARPETPLVLIAAGAHAEEAAGVIAAWRIARSPGYAGRMLFVPCRDPLGWDGISRTLGRLVGEERLELVDHAHAVEVYRHYGEAFFERGGMAVAVIGPLAFMSLDPAHPGNTDTGEYIQGYLPSDPELVDALRGKTLLVPGTPRHAQGRNVYGWGGGPSVYVDSSGRVGNFNRFFASQTPPVEVAALRELADHARPDWVFDLHENFGDGFGLYTNAAAVGKGEDVYRAMIDAVAQRGFPVMRLKELLPYLGLPEGVLIELYPGVYSANPERRLPPDAFGVYVGKFGAACFTTEMGLERPLEFRCEATEIAVRAGLRTIERRSEMGQA